VGFEPSASANDDLSTELPNQNAQQIAKC